MARLWSEEIGDARSVIEPLVRALDPSVEVQVDGGQGLTRDVVEVILKRSGRQLRCVVTFEAWVNARKAPDQMKAAFQDLLQALEGPSPAAYVLTSKGLRKESPKRPTDELRDIAASEEADRVAERLLKGRAGE